MLGFLSVHHPFIPVASFSSTIGNFHIPRIFKKINKNKNKNKGVGGEEGEGGMGERSIRKKRKRKYERKDKKKKSPLFHIHIVAFLFGLKFKKGVKEVLLNTPPPSS